MNALVNVLVVAAHDGQQLDAGVATLVTAASQLATPTDGQVHVLVAGNSIAGVASAAGLLKGVASVRVADDPSLAAANAKTLARQIAALSPGYRWSWPATTCWSEPPCRARPPRSARHTCRTWCESAPTPSSAQRTPALWSRASGRPTSRAS